MLEFLEKNLQKKILLAELFYNTKGNFSDKDACDELGISLGTLNLYRKEVNAKYETRKRNGMLYNSNALINIAKEYIQRSSKVQLLVQLICSPSENATFYKNELNLSDATFTRLLKQIRVELKKYDIKIAVNKGYYLKSTNELNVIMFMAYAGRFFEIPLKTIYKKINYIRKDSSIPKLKILELDTFSFYNSDFERLFFDYLNAFILLRCLQNSHYFANSKDFLDSMNKIKEKITYLQKKAETQVAENLLILVEEIKNPHYDLTDLKKVLISAMFQISLFPYNISINSLRISFFINKFKKDEKEKYLVAESVVYRLNRIMKMNFFKRKDTMLFFVICELFVLEKVTEERQVYVFSSLSKKHTQILCAKLSPLSGFVDNSLKFKVIDSMEKITIQKNDLLITTEFCDKFASTSQFLISDYVSLQEIVQIGLWLKEFVYM